LALHRSPDAIWVEPVEWNLLETIAPHLKRAAAIHELLARARVASPGAILDAIDKESHSGSACSQQIERGRQLAESSGAGAPDTVNAMLMALLCRVEIRSDRVDITLPRCRLTELLAGSIDLKMQHQAPTNAPGDILTLTVLVALKRAGREMRMLVENADDETAADPSLLGLTPRLPTDWAEQRTLLGFR
jgi:hypothetical protein